MNSQPAFLRGRGRGRGQANQTRRHDQVHQQNGPSSQNQTRRPGLLQPASTPWSNQSTLNGSNSNKDSHGQTNHTRRYDQLPQQNGASSQNQTRKPGPLQPVSTPWSNQSTLNGSASSVRSPSKDSQHLETCKKEK